MYYNQQQFFTRYNELLRKLNLIDSAIANTPEQLVIRAVQEFRRLKFDEVFQEMNELRREYYASYSSPSKALAA